ncbi:MAG: YqhA family protein [Rhodomicrobium sp.]
MNGMKRAFETVILQSRWLMAPFLLGLMAGLGGLLYKFIIELGGFLNVVKLGSEEEVIVRILKLVDLSLIANLLLILICAGHERYLARVRPAEREKWPKGLIGIGFSGVQQKVLGSIVAIAAVRVLEWFINIYRSADSIKLGWVVGILLAFALAMLAIAGASWLSETNVNNE